MSEDIEDKYPHWKDALFGNHGAVANIRCGIEYIAWHTVYGIITLLGVLFAGAVIALKKIAPIFGPLGGPVKRAASGMNSVLTRAANSSLLMSAVFIVLVVAFLASAGIAVYMLVLKLLANPVTTLAWLVAFICIAVGWALLLAGVERYGDDAYTKVKGAAFTAGSKATETPGVRRVFGKCPVSFKQPPLWFQKIFPEED